MADDLLLKVEGNQVEFLVYSDWCRGRTKMDNDNLANNAGRMMDEGREKVNEYAEKGREKMNEYADKGRDMLNDYADKGMEYVSSANSAMVSFIRDEPILAMATIFAAGYLVARMLNGLSRR